MRSTTLNPSAGAPTSASLDLVRDEPHMIKITGYDSRSVILTIAAAEGAAPVVEIPATGPIVIRPEMVQALTEGLGYFYNVWARDSGDLQLLVKGRITLGNSIAPFGVDWATTFLTAFGQMSGPQSVVSLTAAQYLALIPDENTIYLVRP